MDNSHSTETGQTNSTRRHHIKTKDVVNIIYNFFVQNVGHWGTFQYHDFEFSYMATFRNFPVIRYPGGRRLTSTVHDVGELIFQRLV